MQSSRYIRFWFFAGLAFAICPAAAVAVPVCTSGSLSSYIALDASGGCTVGDLTFLRFSAPTPTTTGSPTVATDSQIMVSPIVTATGGGFSFTASSGETNLFSIFSSSGTTAVTYYIDYSVDPAPVVTGSDLSIDPPFGNASVTQLYCTSDVFADGCALGVKSQQTVTVAAPTSAITFVDPSSFVDIDTDIYLVATPGNPAGIDSVNAIIETGTASVPEPSVLLLTAGPLALLLMLSMRRRKRA